MKIPAPEDSDRLLTLEEFARLPEEDAYRLELVRGRVVREPRPMAPHARVNTRVIYVLEEYAERTGRGVVYTDMGFVLEDEPPTLRGPDAAFVSHERVPKSGYARSFWHFGPDLAVEVLSPSNTRREMLEKVREYFAAGSCLVWILDPARRTVTVYDSAEDVRILRGDAVLDGGDVLPEFRVPLSRLFAV
ncbi:MAG TPA: Uma2 family endonuclease [Longimicrobiales bacterium]